MPRTPEMLHFEIDLIPRGSASDCLRALGWERPVDGGVFLHPAVYGAQPATWRRLPPPGFRTGDVVRVRDSPQVRARGLAGAEVIVGHPDRDGDTDPLTGRGAVSGNVEGQDETEDLAERDLEPTGRRRPGGARIGVTGDGVVPGPAR
ncbi:hypothetical protein ACIP3A_26090 [Streptomyces tricolor]|uniref:hypothetical protein n=1 Tax=Streptomyces tricolor TaxID=68277 RepID=UPI00380099FF